MTERLREELLRVGENVAPIHVSGDLWARGRRARRRDRLATGGVVLSVVGLIFAISMAGWPGLGAREAAPVAPGGDEAGAVPSMLYGVPERFGYSAEGDGETWHPDVAETDLAIGRASVAFASGEHQPLPVVVTAADGRYHLLRLPGWIGASLAGTQVAGAALALSPDGDQLAYGWYDPSTFREETVRAGVRVVDLRTGKLRTVALSGGRGIAVGSVRWSPDSRWIVWQGMQLNIWEQNRTSWQRDAAGRISPGATTSESIRVSRGRGEEFSIDNAGAVSWLLDGAWNSDRSGLVTTTFDLLGDDVGSAGSTSPSGRVVALASGRPVQQATFVKSTGPKARRTSDVVWRDLGDLYPEGATVEPVGWLDDEHVTAVVTRADEVSEGGWTHGSRSLVVMSVGDESTFEAVTDIAGSTESTGQIVQVSVAVDLLDPLKTVSRDFPEPEWPRSDERKAVYIGLSVAAGLGCVLLARRMLRRRRGVLR